MKEKVRVEKNDCSHLVVRNVESYYRAKVTPFGNGAKIGCKKEFEGREVTVLILGDSK